MTGRRPGISRQALPGQGGDAELGEDAGSSRAGLPRRSPPEADKRSAPISSACLNYRMVLRPRWTCGGICVSPGERCKEGVGLAYLAMAETRYVAEQFVAEALTDGG